VSNVLFSTVSVAKRQAFLSFLRIVWLKKVKKIKKCRNLLKILAKLKNVT
jgi:hypothetical protein